MRLTVLIIWSVGLLGATAATLAILKLASLVIYTLVDIAKLAVYTRRAVDGIAVNVTTITRWPDLGVPAGQIASGTQRIAALTRRMRATLAGL